MNIVFWSHTSNKTNRISGLKTRILTQLCTSLETQLLQLRAERKVSNAQSALAYYFRQETPSNPNFRDLNPACIKSYPKKQRPHPAARLDDTSLHWKEAEKSKFTFASGSQPRLEVRGWRGQGAVLGVRGMADGQDMGASGASSSRQRRPSCQRHRAQVLRCRRRKHTLRGPELPCPHAAAPGSLLLAFPQANEGPRPSPVDPRSRWGTVAQHNPNLPPQPDTAGEQRSAAGPGRE